MAGPSATAPDFRPGAGLRPIIDVSGTMTALGAASVEPDAIVAMTAILPHFVEIDDLQRQASRVIARLTGGEAGFVTASCAAGMTLTVAGAMTGPDIATIERLPDTAGLKNEVALMTGHAVNYGAPVEQAIRLAGAVPVLIGQATSAERYQLEAMLGQRTAAALYVVSHHTVQYGLIPLRTFCETCHAANVPVIVDAASEYDLRGFLAEGADLAIYSAHKFLGGPTGGLVAGRKDLVRAAFLQSRGIGRGMKAGKESIHGAIAALEAWERRDHASIRARERGHLALWQQALQGRPGVTATIEPDPTGNPVDRLRIALRPNEAHITAWDLADALARGERPVIVRDDEVDFGYVELDPCNLHPGEEVIVAQRLGEELDTALRSNAIIATPLEQRRSRRIEALRRWPD